MENNQIVSSPEGYPADVLMSPGEHRVSYCVAKTQNSEPDAKPHPAIAIIQAHDAMHVPPKR